MMASGADQEEVYTLLLTDIQVDSMLKKYYHDHLLRDEIGKVISVDVSESKTCAIVKIKVQTATAANFLEEIQGNLKQKDRPETVHCLYSESSAITLNWNASMKSIATGMVEYAKKYYPMVDVKLVEGVQVTISGVAHDVLALQEQYNRYIRMNCHSLLPQPLSISSYTADNTLSGNSGAMKEYLDLSPDVLALLQKLPEGKIPGVQYDTKRGCVMFEGGSPEEESARISAFQTKYQELTTTSRKIKFDDLEIPEDVSDNAIKEVISSLDAKYSQCVFIIQEEPRAVRVISNSSRQFEQAKKILKDSLDKALNQDVVGATSCEAMIIPITDGRRLTLKQSDIVEEDVDIIVNAANGGLTHGAGVAGAINKASNGLVQKYSDHYTQRHGQVPTGRVAYTNAGGRLKCKRIIHAVGPTKSGYSATECEHLLYQLIDNVLRCATKLDASSIAIPAISAGLFGIRKELVATCVIEGILRHKFSKPPPVLSDIRIVIIDQPTYGCFAEIFATKAAASASKLAKSPIKPATFILPTPVKPQPSTSSYTDNVVKPSSVKSDPSPNASSSEDDSSHVLGVDLTFTKDDTAKLHSLLLPLANGWRILGALLGFKKEVMDSLQAANASFLDFIQAWIDGKGGAPTLSSLTEALNHSMLKKDSLATKIAKAFATESDVSHPEVKAPPSGGRYLTLAKDSAKLRSVLKVDPKKWNTLGLLLGFTQEMLHDMASSAGGMESYLNKVIIDWLSGDATQKPTLEVLTAALQRPEMGEEILAAKLLEVYGASTNQSEPHLEGNNSCSSGIGVNSITYPNVSLLGGEPGNVDNDGSKHVGPNTLLGPASFSTNAAKNEAPLLSRSLSDPSGTSKSWIENVASNNTVSLSTTTTTVVTISSSAGTQLPGGGKAIPYSSVVSGTSGKPGRKIAANLGSRYGDSANSELCAVDVSHPVVETKHGITATVVTTQPASLSNKKNDSQGKGHSHYSQGTNKGQGASTTEECSICFEAFKKPTVIKCGHKFCKHCIEKSLKYSPQCPICKVFLRPAVGNQPIDGKMDAQVLPSVYLPGFKQRNTIRITYYFPDGIQGPEHPNPGQRYTGTQRVAYLPHNQDGIEVLKLLQKAFAARLTFTVGRSVTTGQDNTVIWNDIHHKTNTHGGATSYGYPDPTYLQRVKQELAAKGIFPDPQVAIGETAI